MGRVDRVATQFHGKLVAASFDPLRRTDVKGYYPFTLALRGPFGTVGYCVTPHRNSLEIELVRTTPHQRFVTLFLS